jgi:hypothetical protein
VRPSAVVGQLRARLVLVAIAAVIGLGIGVVTSGRADADSSIWGYLRSTPTGVDRDPINVLYRAKTGLASVLASVATDLGWPDYGGSTMYFQAGGANAAQDAQRASDCAGCDRYHLRVKAPADPAVSDAIAATHYEIVTWCGHSSRSFDNARDVIAEAEAAGGRPVAWVFWGNTNASTQCDGYEVAGDGWIAEVVLP